MKYRNQVRFLLILLLAGLLAPSCKTQRRQAADRPFADIALPQVERLDIQDYAPTTISVCIAKNGVVSVGRPHLNPQGFAAFITQVVKEQGHEIPIHIGADVATPFDTVWLILVACRTNGIYSVSFVVTDAERHRTNVIRVLLPRREKDPPELGPLVLKDGAEATVIAVDNGGFVVPGRRLDKPSLRSNLEALRLTSGGSEPIIITPSHGITQGQFMTVLTTCWECGLRDVYVMAKEAEANPRPEPAR